MRKTFNLKQKTPTTQDQLSHTSYYSFIGGFILYSLLATLITITTFAPTTMGIFSLIGLFVLSIGVIFLTTYTDNTYLKFTCSTALSVIFGLILNPLLQLYTDVTITNALALTLFITLFMCIAGIVFKSFFKSIGNILFYSLLALCLIRILQIFVPFLQGLGIIDYIAAGIFSLYIGYDIYRSTELAKTINNALDVALNIYLDIINLFINLLSILDD